MCGSREAIEIGTRWATALQQQQDRAGLGAMIEGMRRAARVVPEVIRADFTLLVDAQVPFLEALARAKSENYATLASDPTFQQAVQKLGSPDVSLASSRVNQWFARHCPEVS
ncbi:MAG: hypothetical protein Q8K63_06205 [Acidimicrobiales bacterium]|nr:hypothetical protein [Acidimicrobiales bacterium]